jgi:hypothetical protein
MKLKLISAALLGATVSLTAQSATIDLTGAGWTTYGDGNAISLPASGLTVMSGPGQISLFTKLGLGADGQLANTAGMDDAFDTPQANNVEGFRMGAANEPVTTGGWDRVGWWDASLSALNGALDLLKNSMVFFFANNETGGTDTASLAVWARVEVSKISDNSVLGTFDLTNNGGGYGTPITSGLGIGAPLGGGVVLGDVTQYTSTGADPTLSDFIKSGNDVCVYNSGPLAGLPTACPSVSDPTITKYVHNLGGDQAAYAIVFPELDQLITQLVQGGNLSDYALHVQYKLGCGPEGDFPTITKGGNTVCDGTYALNGGDEKVFLGTQALPPSTQVPEPSSVMILGLGLLLFISLRRNPRSGRLLG